MNKEQQEAQDFTDDGKRWGEAHCGACGRRWIAVFFEKDRKKLECPTCGTFRGVCDKWKVNQSLKEKE